MNKNAWMYVFAGVSALAGMIYLYNAYTGQSAAPVTNIFPPINAGQLAPSPQLAAVLNEPLPTQTPSTTSGTTSKTSDKMVPYPVFLV